MRFTPGVSTSARTWTVSNEGYRQSIRTVFFFFQAEDGIRDIGVTGVQTCALPISALEANGNGYYAERLSAIGTLREAWSGPALQAMLDLPFALLYLVGIWYLAGPLVLVPLALLFGVALLAALTGRRVRHAAHNLALAEERRFNFLFDTLSCIHPMKVLGAEPLLERRYERLQGGSAQMRRTLAQAISAGQEGGQLLAQAATIGVAAFGCHMVLNRSEEHTSELQS